MENQQHQHNHSVTEKNINTAFMLGIGLNLIFTIIEFGAGYHYNSLALLSDAGHNLSDVAGLSLSLIGFKLAKKAATKDFTYGYKKATILASLINAVLLLLVVVEIVKEAIERFSVPSEPQGLTIVVVASIGVVINTISAFLFVKGKENDINIKGAFLHLLVDALVSVGVVISGVVIYYTSWNLIDPIISLVIAAMIIFSTWGLLVESIRLITDGVPKSVDFLKVKKVLLETENIESIHELHIWAISTTTNALTAHIVMKKTFDWATIEKVKDKIRHQLLHQNVHHITLELERFDEKQPNAEDCGL